jgi:hypothetical protein
MIFISGSAGDLTESGRSRLARVAALLAVLWFAIVVQPVALPALADDPVVTSTRDLNPNDPATPFTAKNSVIIGAATGLWNGRTSSVAIDPRNKNRALTVAEFGGVYGSNDGGQTWLGNTLADGTSGPFGRGFASGLTTFQAIAIDPTDSQNVLVMVEDDNRQTDSVDGIWRSTDGGANFSRTTEAAPACRIRYNASLASDQFSGSQGHMRFSNKIDGLVFASSNCGLGMSFNHGGNWAWLDPLASSPGAGIDGIDLIPSSITGNFDTVGMCLYTSASVPQHSIVLYRISLGTSDVFPAPPTDFGGGCSFVFNPAARHANRVPKWSAAGALSRRPQPHFGRRRRW